MERTVETVLDLHGKPLKKGDPVRYLGTGTTGKVRDILSDAEGVWVMLDTTELLYRPEYLVYEEEVKERREEEVTYTLDEIIRLQEQRAEKISEIEADHENIETGG